MTSELPSQTSVEVPNVAGHVSVPVPCHGYSHGCSCPECAMLDALASSPDAVEVAARELLATGVLD